VSEADALTAAVLADPDADLPRLLFADWCDDHGDPDRAEFVRVQVELARLAADSPYRPPLEDREDELMRLGFARWKVPAGHGVQGFVRGFVELWDGTAEWFLDAAERLFAAAPVRAVRVRVADKHVPALCRMPEFGRVRSLDLSGNMLAVNGRLARLLTDAPLDGLTHLNLGNNNLFADALGQVLRSPVAGRLTALDLSGNPLTDDGLRELAGTPALARLESLTVRNNEQTDDNSVHADGAAAIGATRHFPRLTRLDLSGHRVGDAGLVALIGSPLMARLVELRLAQNGVGRSGDHWAAVVTDRLPAAVARLDLSGRRNVVSLPAARRLVGWRRLADGLTVDLRGCTLEAGVPEVLTRCKYPGLLHAPSGAT
jgi:uncharacterized protein (TIGR02996 family)